MNKPPNPCAEPKCSIPRCYSVGGFGMPDGRHLCWAHWKAEGHGRARDERRAAA